MTGDAPDVTPDRMPDVTPDPTDGPLTGVRVLDLTRVLSGPHCTRMLCDMGAEVIKVEPPAGDMTRFASPRINGLSSYFVQQNAGKRNISLDMDKPEAREILLALADRSDVLVENFRGGVADKMGIGYETVSARNPGIVYASISGYGNDGPWKHRRAYAPVVGAESGLTQLQGEAYARSSGLAEPHFANDPHSHADVYTGLEAASAILAALFQRARTGTGTWIDVSMAQTMLYVNEHMHDHLWDGDVDPDWIRSFGPGDYPVLTAANGETVVISGHPAERGTFDRFVAAIDQRELAEDPRFVDVRARLDHLTELLDVFRQWAAQMPDADSIERAMDRFRMATGKLRSARELCDTEWARERHVVASVSDRGRGSMRIPNSPWKFSNMHASVRGAPRYRGEDNHAVLQELLGLDDDALQQLDDSGVLSSRLPGAQPAARPTQRT
jgi:crotonobetainyl-CoA:carnitine CoA-transferase CaiB-like acyl-CoA transferase